MQECNRMFEKVTLKLRAHSAERFHSELFICSHNLMKTGMNFVKGQKLKTLRDLQNFYRSYRFHFECCENARKRARVHII